MVDDSQGTGLSPASSIPCAQESQNNTHHKHQQVCPYIHIIHYSKMLHRGSLLQQANRHLRNPLLHTSNNLHCYGPQPQVHLLHQDIRVSHNLFSQQLAHDTNLAGNQGSLHHLGKHSTHLPSLSFQYQRHSKIMLYTTRKSQKYRNLKMGKVSRMVDQTVACASTVDNQDT